MSSIERATSPSPGGKLSKLRIGRKKNGNESSQSLPTTAPEGDNSERRRSVEGMMDKLRPNNRRSADERRGSTDASRLSKLVPNKMKRRKSDDGRENSTISNDSGEGIARLSRNPSEQSLGLLASSRSSLLTEDSAESPRQPVRPTLSPHASHAGYLTLSSPLIKATTTEGEASDTDLAEVTASTVSVPIIREPPESPIVPLAAGQPEPTPVSRASSHTDRLKGAFGGRKKGSIPDTDPTSAPGGVEGADVDEVKSKADNPLLESENVQPFPSYKDNDKLVTPSKPSKAAAKLSAIDTKRPQTPPNTVQTPRTFVTPPTPTLAQGDSPPKNSTPKTLQPFSPPTFGFRSRPKSASLSASKLSNSILSNPLTPPLEETKTPGGSLTQPSQSGFFSSWVSVAQNAANSITTTFNPPPNQKSKQVDRNTESANGEEVIPGPEAQSTTISEDVPQPAVETLGQGELNLSHLGITDSADPSPMSSATNLAGQGLQQNGETSLKAEEDAAARAVSVAYEKPIISAVSQATGGRPVSMVSSESNNEHSPPRTAAFLQDSSDIKRSGSIRSKLSERKQRRHRASSATTGGTLAAAISASTSTIAHPGATNGHKMTGFAVASSKRNKDFHQLFRSVPEDDYLIEDYSAALQRDILLHGRFYVSEGHICFSSNIFGWVTNLVIAFDEIVSVEKKNTAVVFPNAIVIQTLHARNVFASLVARDATYDLLIGIWKTSHPNLKSSINGVTLGDDGTGDKTEKTDLTGSDDESVEGSDDVYDEDAEDDEELGSFTEAGANGSIAGSDIGDIAPVPRKASSLPMNSLVPSPGSGGPKGLEGADAVITGAAVAADFPGPPMHEATECTDQSTHYDRPLIDTTLPAPLGKIYSIMFGPASGAFMRKWLVEDQQSRELVYEDDKTGLDDSHKTFTYSYIKPLNAPIGPKQTKCLVTANLLEYDLTKSISIDCSTATPDVPSGNVFATKTRYCLMWGPSNTTRFIATCTIEWSGKSWLKGPIEKGANDGQIQYVKDIVAAVKAAVTTKPPVKGQPRGKGKGKRRKETFDTAGAETERASTEATKADQAVSWGPLEPVRGLLEPIVSIFKPFISTQLIIGVLVLLLAQSWFFGSGRRNTGVGYPLTQPERLAAYEAMWQREEAELWDWLEGRVGLEDGIPKQQDSLLARQKAIKSNAMGRKIDQLVMKQGQAEDAMRVTGERLEAFKEAWEKRKVNKFKS